MKRAMQIFAGVFTIGTIIFTIAYMNLQSPILLSLSITFGTFMYHFVMRLTVGGVINCIFHNKLNYRRKWFQQKKWETGCYKNLKVKTWKDKMPTYDVETFSVKMHSMEEIVQGMCQSEIIHEIIVVLSFVPLMFSICFESFVVFFITSILAAAFDMMFVIMQRYNRPRLVRLIRKKKV